MWINRFWYRPLADLNVTDLGRGTLQNAHLKINKK